MFYIVPSKFIIRFQGGTCSLINHGGFFVHFIYFNLLCSGLKDLLDIIDLLKRYCFPEKRWIDLGLRLGLHKDTLDTIKGNHSGDVSRCLTECLSQWLHRADNVYGRVGTTWDLLSDALRYINEISVAEKLDQESKLQVYLSYIYFTTSSFSLSGG